MELKRASKKQVGQGGKKKKKFACSKLDLGGTGAFH